MLGKGRRVLDVPTLDLQEKHRQHNCRRLQQNPFFFEAASI
jgi:hypothetical protein